MAVKMTELENGIRVVTHAMPHLASATLGVWIAAGSRNETKDEHGISHLIEHMAFKGTERRSAKAIAEEIENVGGEVNAATSIESTSYYARVLAGDVPLALDILADILQHSTFEAEELAREKQVVVQEIGAVLDAPEDLVFDHFQETAFPEQPIGRPILGTAATVEGFSEAALRAYLARHYTGKNTIVAAAGKVEHAEILRLVRERFAAYGTAEPPLEAAADYRGGERREERDLMEAQIVLGFPSVSYHADEFTTAQIASALLGGGMSSRLFQEIRENRGLCYSIYSSQWSFRDAGLFAIAAATSPENAPALIETALFEVERAIDTITEGEVMRAQAQLRAGLLMALESPTARANQIARQVMTHGRPLPLDELVAKINAVTPQMVRTFLARTFLGVAPTLAAIGPLDTLPGMEVIAGRLALRPERAA